MHKTSRINKYAPLVEIFFPAKMVSKSEILTSSQVQDSKFLYISGFKTEADWTWSQLDPKIMSCIRHVTRLITSIS